MTRATVARVTRATWRWTCGGCWRDGVELTWYRAMRRADECMRRHDQPYGFHRWESM